MTAEELQAARLAKANEVFAAYDFTSGGEDRLVSAEEWRTDGDSWARWVYLEVSSDRYEQKVNYVIVFEPGGLAVEEEFWV